VSILHSARDLERARATEGALPVVIGRFAPIVAGLPYPPLRHQFVILIVAALARHFARGWNGSLAQAAKGILYLLFSSLQVIDVLYRQREQRRVIHRLDPTEVLVDIPPHRPIHARCAEARIARYRRVV